jgi:hypothetical protein
MIFISAGLKYHDTTIRIRDTNEGNISFMESPDAICENAAPDIAKKKLPFLDYLIECYLRSKKEFV